MLNFYIIKKPLSALTFNGDIHEYIIINITGLFYIIIKLNQLFLKTLDERWFDDYVILMSLLFGMQMDCYGHRFELFIENAQCIREAFQVPMAPWSFYFIRLSILFSRSSVILIYSILFARHKPHFIFNNYQLLFPKKMYGGRKKLLFTENICRSLHVWGQRRHQNLFK